MEIRDNAPRFSFFTRERDIEYLRAAIRAGERARAAGNHPFGAVLVDGDGNILLEQGNVEVTEHDHTGHAETALARAASKKYDRDFLWNCSLYTSFEPCAMCAGAAYWTNIGRIVYGASEHDLLADTGANDDNPTFDLDCRTVLSRGQKAMVVCGPYPEVADEARASQAGYWD
ncbi:nucleoside deaminase [Ruminococcaceae bacterium OttesenSCG-928-D13]|nr:nucleoside deaminase [Ruminococcaceae bacterium OttesenSCG-928-D13]